MSGNKEYSINMRKYFDLLNKNRVLKDQTEGRTVTHRSLGEPYGNFDFSGEKNQKLLDIYTKAIYDKNSTNNDVYLVETHLPQGPIVIDIDIKYNSNLVETEHKYSIPHIEKLLEIYNRNIKKYVNINYKNNYIVMSNNNSNITVNISTNNDTYNINTFNENNKYLTSVNFESFVTSLDKSNVNTFNENNKFLTSTNFERFVEGLLKLDLIIHKQMMKIKKKKIIINI